MFKFEWTVPANGFTWAERALYFGLLPNDPAKLQEAVRARARKGRFLVPIPGPGERIAYDVFGVPALFRKFAALPQTEEGVLHFANQHGSLGGQYSRRISEPDPNQKNAFWPGDGELLRDWLKEIGLMRHVVVDLYDNIKARNARNLLPFITWERFRDDSDEKVRVFYTPPPIEGWKSNSIVVYDQRRDEGFRSLRHGDVLVPAWRGLLEIVGAQLKQFPLPAALRDTSAGESHSAQLVLPAPSLVAALWLQLARAIAESREFKPCKECGEYFETTTDKRVDAQFCSPACRLRAHRKRLKAEASPQKRRKVSK